jgi:hypothetical protein
LVGGVGALEGEGTVALLFESGGVAGAFGSVVVTAEVVVEVEG